MTTKGVLLSVIDSRGIGMVFSVSVVMNSRWVFILEPVKHLNESIKHCIITLHFCKVLQLLQYAWKRGRRMALKDVCIVQTRRGKRSIRE